MNIYKDKLEVGQVFKNYKVMCEYLGEDLTDGGNSKKAHVKNWERHFKIIRKGHSFIIDKVYDYPLPILDNRQKGGNRVKEPMLITHPEISEEWSEERNHMKMPSSITRTHMNKFWWRCRNCKRDIFMSPNSRTRNPNGTCEYCSLSIGAKKIYLELIRIDVNFNMEKSFKGLKGIGGKSLRFDFEITEGNQTLGLIEFDGGYHDEETNPCADSYKMISTHDHLKNEYCNEMNIPLLRIHHSEIDFYRLHINNFLQSNKIKENRYNITEINNEKHNKLLVLIKESKKINTEINKLQDELEGWL